MKAYRTVAYNPRPGEKLVFGMKPGKSYTEEYEVPDPWYFSAPEPGYILMRTVSDSAFRSQGYGASRYAKGSADNTAENYRAAGFEVIVREVAHERKFQHDYPPTDYQVWVRGENVFGEFEPFVKVSVVEWVRSCWKRGVNPRVYNPFLPAGFEEKHGLDYFGGYVKKD